MPFETTLSQLPCGARYLRLEVSGTLSGEDAGAILQQVNPGGALHGIPSLVLTERLGSFTPEARAVFGGRGELAKKDPWIAVVVTNPVIRVTANFIMRIQRSRTVRLFSTEPEAIRWLDERVRGDQAGASG